MNPVLAKAAPWAVAVVLLGGWRTCDVMRQREIGALTERLHVTDSSLKVAERRTPKLDTVFQRDTIRLTRRITETQTLIDTLLHSDTVTLTRRESVLVFAADSLVQQCRATVQSCSELTANLRTRLQLTETQRDAYRRLVPSGFGKARSTLGVAALAALATYLLVRK